MVVTPAPRRQHRRGAGQGRRHDRRAGRPGPGRRVRALRRQRERGRGVEHRAARSSRSPSGSASSTPALAAGVPDVLEIGYEGQLADSDTRILTLSVLKGVFGRVSEEPVSYVNAPRLAEERGVEVRESSSSTSHDYVNLVTMRGGDHAIGGTLVGLRGEPRIVMVDDHSVDVPPADHMLVVRNDDVPGHDRRGHRRARRGRHQHRRHAPRPLGRGRGRPHDPRHRRGRARGRAGRHPRPARRRQRGGARSRLSAWPGAARRPRPRPRPGSSGRGWCGRSSPCPAGGRSSTRASP